MANLCFHQSHTCSPVLFSFFVQEAENAISEMTGNMPSEPVTIFVTFFFLPVDC
uniref:Uncharacterized protein n=1 Tax=Arundo donax TaxID=35708 RepID=A0A0A9CSP8_ARUDO